MRENPASPLSVLRVILQHRELLVALIRRDVAGKYKTSTVGMFWSFLNPLLMLAVYTFVFSVVFKARWSAGGESKLEFAVVLFVGMLVFNLFADCVLRAPGLIVEHAAFVKRIVFPLEILPVVILGSALFHLLAGFTIWLVVYTMAIGPPHPTVLLLPLVILPPLLLAAGCAWALSSIGVYLRDISQGIGVLTTALMMLSPIFYPVSVLPREFRWVAAINPLTLGVEQLRGILVWGQRPDWGMYLLYLILTSLVAWLGLLCFQKTRGGFADVL